MLLLKVRKEVSNQEECYSPCEISSAAGLKPDINYVHASTSSKSRSLNMKVDFKREGSK